MTIFGWDASHYDWDRGPMDLAAAKRDGMQFATHKVSEGTGYADPRFATFAARARAAGIPLIGGYCVNLRGDQKPQVDQYIRRLDVAAPWWRDGDWLVQLDCERWSDKDGVYAYEPRLYEITAWCEYFMQRTGGRWRPIVYAPRWVYGDALTGLPYPLWASSFGANPAVGYRSAYPGDGSSRWSTYSGQVPAILQFGSETTIGTQHTCDANAYRGSLDQLAALTRGADMTPQEQYIQHVINYRAEALKANRPIIKIPAHPGGPAITETNELAVAINDLRSQLANLATGGIDVDALIAKLSAGLADQIGAIVRAELGNTKLGPIN